MSPITLLEGQTMTNSTMKTTQQIILETERLILRAAKESDAVALHKAFRDEEVMRYWSSPPHPSLSKTKTWLTNMISSPQNGRTDFMITLKHDFTSPASNSDPDSLNDDPLPIGKIGVYRPLPSNELGFLIAREYWGRGLGREAVGCVLRYLFSLLSLSSPDGGGGEDGGFAVVGEGGGTSAKRRSNTGSGSGGNDDAAKTDTPNTTTTTTTNLASNPTPETYTSLPPSTSSVSASSSPSQLRPIYRSISADVDPRNAACRALLTRVGFREVGFLERTDCVGGEWVDSVYYRVEREEWDPS